MKYWANDAHIEKTQPTGCVFLFPPYAPPAAECFFSAQAAEAPHFLPSRNGGKNREGPGPFEPRALFSTLGLRPLSPVTAGQICADAQDWPAGEGNLPKLAWEIILEDSVGGGTVLRGFADSTGPLKRVN